MHERACPICGSDAHSRFFRAANIDSSQLDRFAFASRKVPELMHHRLLLCTTCDLVYASPIPETAALEAAYSAAAFDSQAIAVLAARTNARLVSATLDQLPDRAGALDIGTGEGAFLAELLRLGFSDVGGVEPSAAPIAAAAPEIRSLIRRGMFEPGAFPRDRYSLVTCFQTIEHVNDPSALCREAIRLLKPGGMLCLVGHNRRAFSAKVLGSKSPIFDLEHLQLFSHASMHRLLVEAGFENVRTKSIWNSYPLDYWARLFPIPARLKRSGTAALAASGLGRLRLPLPAGNLLAYGFRPRKQSSGATATERSDCAA